MQLEMYLDKVELRQYQGNPVEDLILFNWWLELHESGDIDNLLFPSAHRLGAFLGLFSTGKNVLVYSLAKDGKIWFAGWGEGIGSGIAWLSVWVRRSARFTKLACATMHIFYEKAFQVLEVVQGITKQERLLRLHQRMGYKIVGKFNNLWEGIEPAWLLILTKDDFMQGCMA